MLLSHVRASREPPGFPGLHPCHLLTSLCCNCLLIGRSPPLSYCEGRQDRVTIVSPAPGTVPPTQEVLNKQVWNEKQTSIVQGQGLAPVVSAAAASGGSSSTAKRWYCDSAQERSWNPPLVTAGDTQAEVQGERIRQESKCRATDVRGLLMPESSTLPARRAVRRGGRPLRARDEPLSARGQVRLSGQRIQVRSGSCPPASGPGDSPAVWV